MMCRRLLLAFVTSSLVAGGCSGTDAATPEQEPTSTSQVSGVLSAAQANRLAGVLYENHQAGGAKFTAKIPFGAAAEFQLDGAIDWTEHVGQATLTTRFANGQPDEKTDLMFTQRAVLDGSIRSYDAELQALGFTGLRWTVRAPAPQSIPLDVVLALIMGMASEQRENPLLVRQSGATLVRSDELAGEPVDVFRYGDRTQYWIGNDGRLRRIEAELAVAEGTTVIDLDLGAQQIALPTDREVIKMDQLPPEIQALLSRPR